MARVETGPVQFGDDDWPGVFIRGDNALAYAQHLQRVLDAARMSVPVGFVSGAVIEGLLETLRSCRVQGGEPVARLQLIPWTPPESEDARD